MDGQGGGLLCMRGLQKVLILELIKELLAQLKIFPSRKGGRERENYPLEYKHMAPRLLPFNI